MGVEIVQLSTPFVTRLGFHRDEPGGESLGLCTQVVQKPPSTGTSPDGKGNAALRAATRLAVNLVHPLGMPVGVELQTTIAAFYFPPSR